MQQLGESPDDISNDDEKQKTGIKELKLYKTIKENVTEKVSSINKQNKK